MTRGRKVCLPLRILEASVDFMLLGQTREAWLGFVHRHKNQRREQTTESAARRLQKPG